MLKENAELYFNTFAYRFLKSPENPDYQLKTIGWQLQTSTSYNWNGMQRPEDEDHCVFQYTLSGEGFIRIENNVYALDKCKAFLIDIPSNHNYYISQENKKWEFIFIHIYGLKARQEYSKLKSIYGNIIELSPDSAVIEYLWKVYWDAANKNIIDGYQTSAIAYQFIMELYRSNTVSIEMSNEKYGEQIHRVVEYINNNYYLQLSLEDLAASALMSKFHFNRIFTKLVGTTPWNYLTKIRLEKSVQIMLTGNQSIDEISKLVGFSGENYFCKVFRKYLGTSPAKFRDEHFEFHNYHIKL